MVITMDANLFICNKFLTELYWKYIRNQITKEEFREEVMVVRSLYNNLTDKTKIK